MPPLLLLLQGLPAAAPNQLLLISSHCSSQPLTLSIYLNNLQRGTGPLLTPQRLCHWPISSPLNPHCPPSPALQLVYLNDLLSSGEVPDLFTPEERDEIINAMRGEAKAQVRG